MFCCQMGIPYSCSSSNLDDLDSRLESFLVRSVSFGSIDVRTEPGVVTSFGSRKMIFKRSHSFKGREMESMISFSVPSDMGGNMTVRSASHVSRENGNQLPAMDSKSEKDPQLPSLEPGNQRSQAALKLQKVYKSFRTRRQLADCAILVEQRWWKLLDFAELKHSSISFFDVEKPETAVSRWSRARTRAAKVGKGLLKDEKARKLALQHWLEAIDPRHRYGHNLQFYYVKWLNCESKQPFFYWLDIGEGKEVSFDKCPRSKLQQQCIKYLGPTERKAYEVAVDDGKFFYKQTSELLDTRKGPKDAKWIFVLSTSKTLYVGQKAKGTFQHSSFLAGGATLSAGRLVVEDGILKAVWPHSGHYLPTEENFKEFMLFLKEHNVDLSIVQKSPTDEEEEVHSKETISFVSQNNLSEPDFNRVTEETHHRSSSQEETDSSKLVDDDTEKPHIPLSRSSKKLCSNISKIEIPRREDVFEMFKKEGQKPEPSCSIHHVDSVLDGYETAEEILSDDEFMVSKLNLYDEDQEEYAEPIPKEKIIQRINSHKGMKSYQLAQQLSCRWTTGAGPRIGCVRDYPSQLQFRALEEVNLSPRSAFSSPGGSARHSPMGLTPTSSCREMISGRSPLSSDMISGRSPLSL
ncbi:IQ domain-containing protein IQM6-like [Cornus florida]|uniref:IQ domain-containing protein IQM6-like n=1 Tax=Cornus florida TaxID=4283 RepID=UPI002899D36C|nr:IQ domain-containing protein IQM6-like [Cornus florida]